MPDRGRGGCHAQELDQPHHEDERWKAVEANVVVVAAESIASRDDVRRRPRADREEEPEDLAVEHQLQVDLEAPGDDPVLGLPRRRELPRFPSRTWWSQNQYCDATGRGAVLSDPDPPRLRLPAEPEHVPEGITRQQVDQQKQKTEMIQMIPMSAASRFSRYLATSPPRDSPPGTIGKQRRTLASVLEPSIVDRRHDRHGGRERDDADRGRRPRSTHPTVRSSAIVRWSPSAPSTSWSVSTTGSRRRPDVARRGADGQSPVPIRSSAARSVATAPFPLYYYLLHVWMGFVGHSDAAIRSLSGLFGVLALRSCGGWYGEGSAACEAIAAARRARVVAFRGVLATEPPHVLARVLLVVAGIGAAQALLSASHRAPRGAARARHGAPLHAPLGAVPPRRRRVLVPRRRLAGTGERRRGGAYGLVALVAARSPGCHGPHVPVPARTHGHPVVARPAFAAAFGSFASFVVNESVQAETLSLHLELALLCFIVLLVFGFAAAPAGATGSTCSSPASRARGARRVALGTLAVGWWPAAKPRTAFQARYSSVVFPVLVILVALGSRPCRRAGSRSVRSPP